MINKLLPDSAAAAHGLRSGDILLRIDGEILTDPADLTYELARKQIGDTATFDVLRDHVEIVIAVGFNPENQQQPKMP